MTRHITITKPRYKVQAIARERLQSKSKICIALFSNPDENGNFQRVRVLGYIEDSDRGWKAAGSLVKQISRLCSIKVGHRS